LEFKRVYAKKGFDILDLQGLFQHLLKSRFRMKRNEHREYIKEREKGYSIKTRRYQYETKA